MASSVVLLSGGMDSAVLLAHVEDPRLALSVDYGQRHRRELEAAAALAAYYEVEHLTLDLSGWGTLLTGSSLTDSTVPVPLGHYAAPTMAATVVPNRNAVLLMAAAGIAAARNIDVVATAVHAGDHPVYPDCRPEFIDAAASAALAGTGGAVTIIAPFVHMTKTDVAARGATLDVPLELTWSCYQGGTVHCGRCGTCTERREAFRDAGLADPTEYA